MAGDFERHKLFTRRALMLGAGKAALLSALGARMYYLQVIEADTYRTLAEENRINFRLVPPPRGGVTDRFGEAIAANRQNYRVVLIPEQAKDITATLERLSLIIPVSEGERRRILREVKRKKAFVPVTVRDNLRWRDVAAIEVNTPDLPGVQIEVGESRYYPYSDDTAHVLGYVAAVSDKEMGGDPLLQLPGFRIGKAGIEKLYDLSLRGSGGTSQVEVNAYGREIRVLSRQEGQAGAKIRLTIDMGLQTMVNARLAGESASAVVIDVHTGDILAMASTPSFDPNAFNQGLSSEQWQELVSNPMAPLNNKAISGQYAPGSTFKMIVALAALEAGVVTPGNKIGCSGKVTLGDSDFHCWKKGGHGPVDLVEAIAQSCDVYFYDIARRTGIERISEMARRLGLGDTLGLDLPGERKGLMPTKAWKMGAIGTPWQVGETMIAGIGQGYVLTTPLQLAVMTARLVNGGHKVSPHMTIDDVTPDGVRPRHAPAWEPVGLRAENMAVMRKAMDAVVNETIGTAFGARIRTPDRRMGGKTGTVQVRRISKAERETGVLKNEELPWKERDHALFVGYAPTDNPRYAISVVVEHGGGGSSVAAPIARDILDEAQKRGSARAPLPLEAQEQAGLEAKRGGGIMRRLDSLNRPDMTIGQKMLHMHWLFLILLSVTAAIGFGMLYSAAGGSLEPWAERQMIRFGLGVAGLMTIALIDIRLWLRYAYLFYGIALVLLVAVEFMGFVGMGAQRWVNIAGVNIQPSELMKIGLVLALARYFHGESIEDIGRPTRLIVPVFMVAMPAVLILRQPDLGTTLMLGMAALAMFFVAGVRMWKFGVLGGLGLISLPIAWQFLHNYQKQRVLTFLNPERDPLGAGYHIIQSKIAFGSGGMFGKGFMQGTQAHLNFLPEKQTDFIFTMLAEEFGLVGGLVLLSLYTLILIYGFAIAINSRSHFGRLVAMGVVATFFLYIFINIAMVMGLIPVVGVPLPLISYGGTVMLTLLAGFGLLMNVHIHRDIPIERRGSFDD